MEDRHSVSDPRPVDDDGRDFPSWEVDILRDGVIVDTFILNKEVLPPRTNKKGKVVWKLPDSGDKLPSFGTDDRRRILDIHKERKKKRKQDKKKQNISPTKDRCQGGGKCDLGDQCSSPVKLGGGGNGVGNAVSEEEDERYSSGTNSVDTTGKGNVKENGKSASQNHGVRDDTRCNHNQQLDADDNQAQHEICPSKGSSLEPSKNQQTLLSATPPPPGLEIPPNMSSIRLDDAQDIPTPHQSLPSDDRPSTTSHASFIQLPPADALFITVPHSERLEIAPGQPECSLAVPAARHFISTYYSHFDGTFPGARIIDLACYYTSEAQKSVSIGGAHSVVTGRADIATQICNFAGTLFEVRGVVAQDTADRKGVHILVTGIARTSLSGSQGGVVASFAHSISLVPIDAGMLTQRGGITCTALLEALAVGYPFQIHNDALALLSGDAGPTSPISTPRPIHKPPPPPGLG